MTGGGGCARRNHPASALLWRSPLPMPGLIPSLLLPTKKEFHLFPRALLTRDPRLPFPHQHPASSSGLHPEADDATQTDQRATAFMEGGLFHNTHTEHIAFYLIWDQWEAPSPSPTLLCIWGKEMREFSDSSCWSVLLGTAEAGGPNV